ncbi:unnamed protein product [Candidula unifasciata]|uniref:Claudin n=1 Tax=Candidula unifasciata TaxID=100452 RepID=A0A8S3YIP4_9EUPU|nr:unnamed protein product [Candidula unifasciata]
MSASRLFYILYLSMLFHEGYRLRIKIRDRLVLQLTALASNSWVVVDCIQTEECPYKKILLESGPGCYRTYYKLAEIARAGLWTVCYQFPHLEEGHTDPYCADFSEDFFQEEKLLVTQTLCILSVFLTTFGLLALGCDRLLMLKNNAFSSSASVFFGVAGLCGLAGCIGAHLTLTQGYVVLYYSEKSVIFKWWAFHLFMDGAILNLTAWLLNGWTKKKACSLKHW